MRIRIIQNKHENHKLQFVKSLKSLTGLGLKEAKWICDDLNRAFDNGRETKVISSVKSSVDIEVSSLQKLEEFKEDIKNCSGDYSFITKEWDREIKLVSLVGNREDYINLIYGFYNEVHALSQIDFIKEILDILTEDQLKQILLNIKQTI